MKDLRVKYDIINVNGKNYGLSVCYQLDSERDNKLFLLTLFLKKLYKPKWEEDYGDGLMTLNQISYFLFFSISWVKKDKNLSKYYMLEEKFINYIKIILLKKYLFNEEYIEKKYVFNISTIITSDNNFFEKLLKTEIKGINNFIQILVRKEINNDNSYYLLTKKKYEKIKHYLPLKLRETKKLNLNNLLLLFMNEKFNYAIKEYNIIQTKNDYVNSFKVNINLFHMWIDAIHFWLDKKDNLELSNSTIINLKKCIILLNSRKINLNINNFSITSSTLNQISHFFLRLIDELGYIILKIISSLE